MFCFHYIGTLNIREASEKTDISYNLGQNYAHRPHVRKFINFLLGEIGYESLITRQQVEHELMFEFLPMAKGEKPIKGVDRNGEPWEECKTDMTAFGKALDLMSRHSGFVDEGNQVPGLTININHQALGITVDVEEDIEDGEIVDGA